MKDVDKMAEYWRSQAAEWSDWFYGKRRRRVPLPEKALRVNLRVRKRLRKMEKSK